MNAHSQTVISSMKESLMVLKGYMEAWSDVAGLKRQQAEV